MSENADELSSASPAAGSDFALPMLIPEGIRYNCQGCGRCCSGWAVGLTEKDYAKVEDTDWGSLHPELAGKELFVHRQKEFASGLSAYPHYTRAREDGSCSFLIDNLCFIHSTLGEQSKPGICKLFPYTLTATPSGIYAGLVYGSMAAVRNMGNLLTEQRPMLEKLWQTLIDQERQGGRASDAVAQAASSVSAAGLASIEYKINLATGVPLTWDEFLRIEKPLLALVRGENSPDIFHALIACSELLAEASRIKSAAGDLSRLEELKPSADKWLATRPTLAEELLVRLLYFKNFEWPSIRKQFPEDMAAAGKNPLTEPCVIGPALKAVLFGHVELATRARVNIDQARKLRAAPLSLEIEAFFRRYFHLKLFSKTFAGSALSGLSVVSGFNNLIGNFLCAITFAKAQALLRGEAEIRISDLYEAYFLIDRELVSLSQLPKERASFYDMGFSSPRLFNRLVGESAATFSC